MKPVLQRGKLVKWNDDRGFGFIQPNDQSQEVFLHISGIARPIRRPRVGDIIHYRTITRKNGKSRACSAMIQGATALKAESCSLRFESVSATLVLEVGLLALLPILGSIHFAFTQANPTPLFLYPAMSGITFVLYHDDKSRAQGRRWRIPENTLHLCELCGGWLGAYVAQRLLRHKSSKTSYQREFFAIVTAHLVGWLTWFFLKGRFL
ncbi:MAG: cold shock and DUF1294 domain-containing protein [Plectolyngbya sp. WJT66-NPBG17]|jgi:uncharacterized membrane protein YsdA (DUF1294 family)/cold shock CspA family protein|nr:cold shock and DUF1294 domain-containing protein [Plectolyngbya sp. WJT66-NPBG17]MBW4528069.1 cold shock and DUF1294 domain-containing protein [Phormidium tanganyikae FI6-MK23]